MHIIQLRAEATKMRSAAWRLEEGRSLRKSGLPAAWIFLAHDWYSSTADPVYQSRCCGGHDCAPVKPKARSWIVHRPPAGRLARPIAVFRDALAGALRRDNFASLSGACLPAVSMRRECRLTFAKQAYV